MYYILMDLEWNQPLSHRSAQYRRYGSQLMFDIIQIGAVKLNEQMQMVGSFNQYIQPGLYRKLHPRITRITGINQEDLHGALPFTEALERFVSWCGEDFALITWGCDDINVFQQNLDFYLKDDRTMPSVYDLQRLFGMRTAGNTKNRPGLQSAMKYFHILPSIDHPFHSAVDDAYYTAKVIQHMDNPEEVLQMPQTVRELAPAKTSANETSDDLRFTNLAQAIKSRPAREPNCPACGKRLKVPEGYVPLDKHTWRALADCPDHGLVLIDMVLETMRDGKNKVKRKAALSDQQNPAYVKTKHLQWANKVAQLPK
ncbi:MAG TPA: exonuclease domain-containing protein [Clostridiales bacterium]|nr:exonuclease domain-containing protein [Clostridiales bacterium]